MRIAYVCADQGVQVFGRKGCSIHVQEVIRAFLRLGCRVVLFTPRPEGSPPAGLADVPVVRLPPAPQGDPAARERTAFLANADLLRALDRHGPYDLVYERYSLWSCAGMEYAQEAGISGMLEVNAPLIEEQAERRTLVDRRSAEAVARKVFAAATSLVAVSEEVASYLESYAEARGRIHVVANGVNPERFPQRRPRASDDLKTTFTVAFVGSLKPWHGLETLTEAFDLLHRRRADARLLVVGDGPERLHLSDGLGTRCLLNAVRLTGAVPPDAVAPLLATMDAAVAPYPRGERFYFSPLKVYEYMAASLPVAASGVGQVQSLIRHGVNGLLCPPGDAPALAAALDLLHGDAALRQRLGNEARATVLRNHTWEGVARRLFALARSTEEPVAASGGGVPSARAR
jgi:glycosyltransferase involved in cell wall biosynthesis